MKIFEDDKLKIDLSALIDSRMLLCANSGGGKSYAIRKLLEEAGDSVMSIILDVEGEFKTLREKFDFLLIGPAGDVPINIKAAQLLPAKLMELNVSTIIDISDLKMHERILYIKHFLEALMELPRKFWKPCLVVVDEAHMYCGQQEKQDSTHAVIDLMTRGRKRGYCGILATQRIAKLHKDAAAEANNYMVGRTGLDIDMKRAAEILGFATRAYLLSLRDLNAGEFYVFGPAISRSVTKTKVAKVKTTHPRVGMDLKGKITPPTEKIKAMLSKLNDLPKEAQEQARTLEEAKKQIRQLERELKQLSASKTDPRSLPGKLIAGASEKQIELARQKGLAEAEKLYKPQLKSAEKNSQLLLRKLEQISQLAEIVPIKPVEAPKEIKRVVSPPISSVLPQARQQQAISSVLEGDIKPGRCERSILSLLYNNPQRSFKKHLLGLFAGYSHKSGGFNNAICRLNAAGLIQRNGDGIILSQEGLSEAPSILGDDINLHETFTIDNWARKLPRCESIIFQFLMQNPHDDFSKEELGENTIPTYQPNSGGFNNAICRLNSLGLIIRQSGRIKLNEEILEL